MSIVYLNGDFMPVDQAKISPLDRGFLFGDGIYEVIPSYDGKLVGANAHIERMSRGLAEIGIELNFSKQQWLTLCQTLAEKNGKGNLALYLHVSRGADNKRHHAYPKGIKPTVFAMSYEIPAQQQPELSSAKGYSLISTEDLRWQRCHVKSTALLGNVMHFQQGYAAGCDEVLLYNQNNELTEASSSNIYIIKNGVVITPKLDHQILAGVTRKLLLDILVEDGSIAVEERVVTLTEVQNADEIWISSSSKEVIAITTLDGKPVGNGEVGPVWEKAAKLYSNGKFNY